MNQYNWTYITYFLVAGLALNKGCCSSLFSLSYRGGKAGEGWRGRGTGLSWQVDKCIDAATWDQSVKDKLNSVEINQQGGWVWVVWIFNQRFSQLLTEENFSYWTILIKRVQFSKKIIYPGFAAAIPFPSKHNPWDGRANPTSFFYFKSLIKRDAIYGFHSFSIFQFPWMP